MAISLCLTACAATGDRRATEDVGPVSAYARNALAEENPAGLLRLGEGFERSGNLVGARKLYGQAMAAAPALASAKIAYARVTAKLGAGDEAVALLTVLLGEEPGNLDAVRALAVVHASEARFKSAFDLLISIPSPEVADLLLAGKAAHALGDAGQGQAFLARALDAAPNAPSVLEATALSFAMTADYPSAVGLLRRAMDQPSAATSAQVSLAKVYALSGQREAAMRLARSVLSGSEVQRLDSFFRFLPQFTAQEQAAALYFNRIPVETMQRLLENASK